MFHVCQNQRMSARVTYAPLQWLPVLATVLLGAQARGLAVHGSSHNPLQELWLDQDIDHFNFRNPTFSDKHSTSTFQQRVYVSTAHWKAPDGPVLFYTGNEGDIWSFINNTGFMFELAPALEAMVVFAEHRYYGLSLPFSSDSFTPQNISFLSVEQAMADFSENVVQLRKKFNMADSSPFIAIGGSYGANLAMWVRLKFPHLFAGALASSATPLKSLLRESNVFYRIVTDVYANQLGLCENMRPNSSDPMTVYGWLVNGLETMVQYGYSYPTHFYNPVPGYPFRVACEAMVADGSPIGAMRESANVYYNWTGQAGACFDALSIEREARVWWNRRVGVASPGQSVNDNSGTAWGYQTCTEVFQPMPTNGVTDMFLPYQPNDTALFDSCDSRWGVAPRPNWEELRYGGSHVSAGSNIFLTLGQLDPWRSAGITEDMVHSPSIVVRQLEMAAHHADLRAPNKLDPPDVTAVRKEELAAMLEWIADWRKWH